MIDKRVLLIALVTALLAIMGVGLLLWLKKPSTATNFEECTKVGGNIILQTYPRQCRTPDGKTFTEEVETSYYGEPFEGTLEFEEGTYYTKEEDKEKAKEGILTYLKGLREKKIPLEKAWYFKSQTSCGMLQIIVSPKIVIALSKELPLLFPKNGENISNLLAAEGFIQTATVSQCANQSGWIFQEGNFK